MSSDLLLFPLLPLRLTINTALMSQATGTHKQQVDLSMPAFLVSHMLGEYINNSDRQLRLGVANKSCSSILLLFPCSVISPCILLRESILSGQPNLFQGGQDLFPLYRSAKKEHLTIAGRSLMTLRRPTMQAINHQPHKAARASPHRLDALHASTMVRHLPTNLRHRNDSVHDRQNGKSFFRIVTLHCQPRILRLSLTLDPLLRN